MAMKINSPHFSHKSDLGAVQLNIRTQAEVEKAFRKLTALGGEGTEVLVQSMVTRGRKSFWGASAIKASARLFFSGWEVSLLRL